MSQDNHIKVPIKGMHCRSCELLVEEKLKDIARVKSADVNHRTGQAVVHYEGAVPDEQLIKRAIAEAGYEVGQTGQLPWLTRDKKEYVSLGTAFLFLMALYLLGRGLGLTNINLSPDLSSASWGLVVVIGLVAGFSTCMALVGGLSLGLSAKFADNHPSATPAEKFRPHLFFVLGRILSYALLGGVLGALGTAFRLSPVTNGILTLLVGLVMLVMGLQLINIFPRLNKFSLTLPKSVGRLLGLNKKNKEYSHKHAMLMGAVTFFLPCGFTQAMQLYAVSTGSVGYGALIMGLFALGTAPGLLSIGGLTALVSGEWKEKFFKLAGLAVIFFALFNLNNGYTLAGFNFGALGKSEKIINDPNVTLENGVQVVRMTETNSGYSPNKFSIKKDVPVKWIIDVQAPYSCASTIVLAKFGIQKSLVAGENIIEFTPTEVGRLPFSCSMGMYSGVFNVYDENTSASDKVGANTALAKSGDGACGGGACGCGGNKASDNGATAKNDSGTCGAGGAGCGCGGNKAPVQTDAKPVAGTITPAKTGQPSVQVIKAVYTDAKYLSPSAFTVKVGTKVRFEIDVRDDGVGCGNAITISGLADSIYPLRAGTPIVMEFTPASPGTYDITCGMNMIRFGSLTVQ